MNIYKGCSHGCIYCDSRSDCYGVDDFDTVRAKENALMIIRDELRRKVKTGVIGTGAMSDLTRHSLELADAFGFGIAVATKSDLFIRLLELPLGVTKESIFIKRLKKYFQMNHMWNNMNIDLVIIMSAEVHNQQNYLIFLKKSVQSLVFYII